MRLLTSLLIGALLCVLCLPSAAADGGLALGFVRHGEQLDRVSMSVLAQAPAAPSSVHARWTAVAQAADGEPLWRWSVPAPQRFHSGNDGRSEFVLVVPGIVAGTRLTLFDHKSRMLWSEVLGHADLMHAAQRSETLKARVDRARAATAMLGSVRRGSALDRQLASLEMARSRVAFGASESVPAIPRLPAEHLSAASAAPAQPTRAAPLSPLSVDIGRAQSAPIVIVAAGTVPVLVTVVDENGETPGVAFPANLFRDGNYLGQFSFDDQGQATLPLEIGGEYALDLLPLAPLVAQRQSFSYSGNALPTFVLEHGWLLDVELLDSVGTPLSGDHIAFLSGSNATVSRTFPLTRVATPGVLRFAVPKSTQWNYYLVAFPADDTHPRFDYAVGALSGDREVALTLADAGLIQGQARAADGAALAPGGSVTCGNTSRGSGLYHSDSGMLSADGSFELSLPLGLSTNCYFAVLAPMLSRSITRTLQPGDTIDVELLRGVPVRFLLQDEAGHPVAAGFSGQWNDTPSQTSVSCYDNPCVLLMPGDRAVEMLFRFDEESYTSIRVPAQQYQAGSEHLIVTEALRRVSGRVLNAEPNAEHLTRVRVYDAENRFVISTLGIAFEFRLRDGAYRFEADHNAPYPFAGTAWTFRQTVSSALVPVDDDLVLPDLVLPTLRGEVTFVVDRPCGLNDRAVWVGLSTADGRRIEAMKPQLDNVVTPPRPPGQCASVHTLGLSPGDYAIDIAPLGWLPQRIQTTVHAGQVQQRPLVFNAADRTEIWNGTLLDAQQLAVANAVLHVLDADQNLVWLSSVDAQGRFEIPFAPGWGVEVRLFGDNATRSVRASRRFGSTPPPPIWQLDQIELSSVPESELRRIYGDGDRQRRLNIVFVAEGFTDVSETFSDLNGNGIWDGVVWYDLNASGAFESQSDRVWNYGNAPYPAQGSVPGTHNEPFVDINNDAVLSLDDPALFVANAGAFLRSLLGSDVWSEHRDAFNVWLMFAPSAQAGHDVLDASGQVLLARDTRYGGSLQMGRYLLEVDATAVIEEALTALPEVDLVVTFLNEPIPAGADNAGGGEPGFIVVAGGVLHNDSNSLVQSHEMGHFVGSLCDEYSTDTGLHPGVRDPSWNDLGCANATLEVDPARVPWSDLLPDPHATLPTRDRDGSLGLFEGAGLYYSGAYRPSMDSTMRSTKTFFNAPSRRALVDALAARADHGNAIFQSGFE